MDQKTIIDFLILICFLITITGSVYTDSLWDHHQEVENGQTYYINNTEYPSFYQGEHNCTWTVKSPVGTTIQLNCILELSESNNCIQDKIIMDIDGVKDLKEANTFCGTKNITVSSSGNLMEVGFVSESSSKGGRFSCELKTQETNCKCGMKLEPKILGGEETGINEYPLMAGIIDFVIKKIYCGGAIIANQYILTAAHCLYEKKKEDLGVIVGEHDIKTGEEAPAVLYEISSFIIHPQYNSKTYINDIAVIKTTQKISFSIYVNPVCLPFILKDTPLTGKKVTLLGWGQTKFEGSESEVLKKVEVKLVDLEQCASVFSNESIRETTLYTHAPNKNICQYDSGGPVILQDPSTKRLVLLGIISSGILCASGYPGINTRVSSYLSWIEEVTPDVSYCK